MENSFRLMPVHRNQRIRSLFLHGISILGRFDDRVADGLLGRKGINGEYRVRVAVADDRQIGGTILIE